MSTTRTAFIPAPVREALPEIEALDARLRELGAIGRPIILGDPNPRNPHAPIHAYAVDFTTDDGLAVRRVVVIGRVAAVKDWVRRFTEPAPMIYTIGQMVA